MRLALSGHLGSASITDDDGEQLAAIRQLLIDPPPRPRRKTTERLHIHQNSDPPIRSENQASRQWRTEFVFE